MKPTIIAYANCQGLALLQLLAASPELTGHELVACRAWLKELPTREQLQRCRALIYQPTYGPPECADALPTSAKRVRVPLVSCSFLWPYSFDRPGDPVGWRFPYGDRFIAGLVASGTEPSEAVRAYLDTDLNARLSLSRLLELEHAKWRAADCDVDVPVADFLCAEAHRSRVFLTPDHPSDAVMRLLSDGVLGMLGLGASPSVIERHTLAGVEVPLHPAVRRHFQLSYVDDDYLYPAFGGWIARSARDSYLHYARALKTPSLEHGLAEASAYLAAGHVRSAANLCTLIRLRQPDDPHVSAMLAAALVGIGKHSHAARLLRDTFAAARGAA